jgi:hypothetical protein
MIAKGSRRAVTLLTIVLMCTWLHTAAAQSIPAQQQAPSGLFQPRPVSLAHLYWHFLVYQNHLDAMAADEEAHGKNGTWMRSHLQTRLGLSDAEFAHVRISSARLTAKVKDLDAQAAAIRAGGLTSTSYDQLKALTDQREAAIHAEIVFLKQTLSPAQIAALESFLTQFFSPKYASLQTSSQPAPAAVQP